MSIMSLVGSQERAVLPPEAYAVAGQYGSMQQKRRRGRLSTVLTGGLGIQEEPSVMRRTLLGV